MLSLDELKQLTKIAMEQNIEDSETQDYLPVPSIKGTEDAEYGLEDVLQCFSKPALLRDMISLVGSVAVHGKGKDVDLVIRADDFSESQKESVIFRLYRAFSDYFNIPYDDTPEYLHITFSNSGTYTNSVRLYDYAIVPSMDRSVHEMEGFSIAKSTDGERIVYGYCSVDVVDVEGDEITIEALEGLYKDFLKKPKKFYNVMDEHGGIQVGEILLEWEDLKTHVDEKGFFVIVKMRRDIESANRVWESILKKELKHFSIHIEYIDSIDESTERVCDKGQKRCWRKITKAKFLEVSFTKNPANELCILCIADDKECTKEIMKPVENVPPKTVTSEPDIGDKL